MLNLPPNHIRPTKLGKRAADHLRKEILEGRLKPGQNLPSESDLMAAFGISRPTLREAIRILESLGLVVVYRGKKGGAEIRFPTVAVTAANAAIYLQSKNATMSDLQQARTCIEPALVTLLVGKIKKKDIAQLRTILDVASKSLDDPARFARTITTFHSELFALLENKVIDLIAGIMHNVYEPMVAETIATFSSSNRRKYLAGNVAAQHQLLDLMEAGKFQEAGEFCRLNLLRIERVAQRAGATERFIDSQERNY